VRGLRRQALAVSRLNRLFCTARFFQPSMVIYIFLPMKGITMNCMQRKQATHMVPVDYLNSRQPSRYGG
jgi:hypothetical protein